MKNDLGLRPDALGPVRRQRRLVGDSLVLAFNLNALMTHLVLPEGCKSKRRKRGLRFALIGVAGRVLGHARRLIVRLAEAHPASTLLIEVRNRILGLAPVPTG